MTEPDRDRIQRSLTMRREQLARLEAPAKYDNLHQGIEDIQLRLAKAAIARREIRNIEAKLNGGRS